MRNLKRTMSMTRFASAAIILIFLIGSAAFSQDSPAQETPAQSSPATNPAPEPAPAPPAAPPLVVPRVQVFGGYSFLHLGLGNLNATDLDADLNLFPRTLVPQTNFNGWNAEGQYNVNPWVGIVVDFSGSTSKPFLGNVGVTGIPTGSTYSILAGPVISYHKWKGLTPYIHALFGWNRTSLSAGTITSTSPIGNTPFTIASSGETFTDFAMAFGGGLDYKISRRFSLRPVQLDWFRTSLNWNSFYGDAFGTTFVQGFEAKEGDLRVSTGIVVNFK